MAILTPSQLQAASDATYFDNTSGSITPTSVRTLNNDWISSSVLATQTGSMVVGTASFALTSSFALNFNPSATASYALQALNSTNAISASYALQATNANNAISASYALQATNANNASLADQATFANTAGTANSAVTASFALNFNPAATASYAIFAATASVLLGFVDSASYAANADLLDNLSSTSFVLTSSFNTFSGSIAGRVATNESSISSLNSATASYITNAQTSSMSVANAVSASRAISALNADTASYVNLAQTASYVANAQTASYVQNALSASYASNAELLDGLNFTAFVLTSSFSPFSSSVSDRLTAAPTLAGNNTFTGNNIFGNVTASNALITSASVLNLTVIYETASVIYSSGSNQFGDASNDVQTLWGTVDVKSGPLLVSGSVNSLGGFTGSLSGNAQTATTASYVLNAVSASRATSAATASSVTNLNQIVTIVGTGNTLIVTGSTAGTAATFSDRSMNIIAYESQNVDVASQLFSSDTGIAGQYIGALKSDFSVDVEHAIIATTNSITLNDWDNNAAVYVPYLSIAPNTGNNPAPQFRRGLGVTGSVNGNVTSASIASNTSSLDFSLGNFYTSLVSGSTNFNITNPKRGQTVNLLLTTVGAATASFSSNVKQVSGSAYTPTSGSGRNDILTFISWDGTSVYLANVKNLI